VSKSSESYESFRGKKIMANFDDAVICGLYKPEKPNKSYYLRHIGSEHTIVYAPTRSGKGISVIIPTLLSWKHSAVILDIKGELWSVTSRWRKEQAGNRVIKLDFTDDSGKSARFNPLREVRLHTPHRLKDIYNLTLMIIDSHGEGLKDHWDRTSYGFLSGLILHFLLKYEKEGKKIPSLSDLAVELSNPKCPFDDLLGEMLNYHHYEEKDPKDGKLIGSVDSFVSEAARSMKDKPNEERGSVKSTTESYLLPFKETVLAEITKDSDFNLCELMHGSSPVSVYLTIPPSDLIRLMPIVRIFVDMIISRNIRTIGFENGLPQKNYNHKLLVLLDEFPSLGRMPIFEKSLAYVAGYGIKCLLVVQDRSQLIKFYGEQESITANCHIRIIYAPNEISTARWISDTLGVKTEMASSHQVSGKRLSLALDNVSHSINHVSRPLLTADEVMTLPTATKNSKGEVEKGGKILMFVSGRSPILAEQLLYFKDPIFKDRAAFGEVECTDVL
jgi:type IV secretion system protein VirD4